MLHNAVQWRAAHGVDDWRATPCDPTTLRDLRRMIPTNPCFAYSKDDGIPIMIQRVGQGDAKIATKYLPDKHVRVCFAHSCTISIPGGVCSLAARVGVVGESQCSDGGTQRVEPTPHRNASRQNAFSQSP